MTFSDICPGGDDLHIKSGLFFLHKTINTGSVLWTGSNAVSEAAEISFGFCCLEHEFFKCTCFIMTFVLIGSSFVLESKTCCLSMSYFFGHLSVVLFYEWNDLKIPILSQSTYVLCWEIASDKMWWCEWVFEYVSCQAPITWVPTMVIAWTDHLLFLRNNTTTHWQRRRKIYIYLSKVLNLAPATVLLLQSNNSYNLFNGNSNPNELLHWMQVEKLQASRGRF